MMKPGDVVTPWSIAIAVQTLKYTAPSSLITSSTWHGGALLTLLYRTRYDYVGKAGLDGHIFGWDVVTSAGDIEFLPAGFLSKLNVVVSA